MWFQLPAPAGNANVTAAGPDGAMWFTESGVAKIGRIAPDGTIVEYRLTSGAEPIGITAGADGALWFTELTLNAIARITTAGTITEFPVPSNCKTPS